MLMIRVAGFRAYGKADLGWILTSRYYHHDLSIETSME